MGSVLQKQMYSPAVHEHFSNPRNIGPLAEATHRGVAGSPGDGPYVVLWLDVAESRIRKAAYQTYGCPAAIACASVTAELATGRSLGGARSITESDVVRALAGLPEGKEHCPRLAVQALADALGGEV